MRLYVDGAENALLAPRKNLKTIIWDMLVTDPHKYVMILPIIVENSNMFFRL